MKHTATVRVVPLLLLLHYVSGNRISCTSSGSVVEGNSASVTCRYHTDIERNKIDFYVYMYSSSKGDPDVSAICAWEDDVLSCELLPGYEVQMHGNTITLNITSAKKSHAGRYSCRVLQSSRDVSVDDCNLSVEVSGKLGKSEETTIRHGVEMQCHAQPHHLHGQPTAIMCFVPEFLNASIITLERREPSGHTTRVEIMRCSKEEDSCIVNIFGYKIRRKHNPLDGFRVIAVIVDGPGLYVCTAEWGLTQTQSCMVEVYKDLQKATAEKNSGQQLEVTVFVILGISLFLLAAALLVSMLSLTRFRKIQTKHKTLLKKKDLDDIDNQADGDGIFPKTYQTLHHKRCSI